MPDTTPDTSMQMKIFVSHNHKDITVCHALVEALRGAGADVWYDEHNMGAGRLTPEVERELKARPVFVVILSPAALGSHWVEDEARWAYTLYRKDPKRIILPVLMETVNDDDIWLFLSDFRRVETPGNQPYPQEEAIRQTLRVLTLTPKGERVVTPTPHPGENPSALLIRGRALLARSQYVEALPFFEQAALRAPNSPDAWFNLGNTLNNLGRPRDGLPATERATELDADNGYAWSNMALALLRLNRYTEALEASDKALNIEETTLRFSYRAVALTHLKRYEEAMVACDKALERRPQDVNAWNGKAWTLCLQGRYSEALAFAERALILDSANLDSMDTMGHILLGLKRFDEAVIWFDRALKQNQYFQEPWEGKAAALRGLGREAEAQEAERRAQELGG